MVGYVREILCDVFTESVVAFSDINMVPPQYVPEIDQPLLIRREFGHGADQVGHDCVESVLFVAQDIDGEVERVRVRYVVGEPGTDRVRVGNGGGVVRRRFEDGGIIGGEVHSITSALAMARTEWNMLGDTTPCTRPLQMMT